MLRFIFIFLLTALALKQASSSLGLALVFFYDETVIVKEVGEMAAMD